LDNLNLPRFLALREQWRRHPPVNWLVAAVLKYEATEKAKPSVQPTVRDIDALLPGGRL
jgi:hypothetical protein